MQKLLSPKRVPAIGLFFFILPLPFHHGWQERQFTDAIPRGNRTIGIDTMVPTVTYSRGGNVSH
jgi:hypothetical protein